MIIYVYGSSASYNTLAQLFTLNFNLGPHEECT